MCNCRRLALCLGNITYILERLASCCALTCVVTCIMTTVLIMLAIGVGLGYNYCYVDNESGRNKEVKNVLDLDTVETHVTTSAKGLIIRPGRKSDDEQGVKTTTTMTPPTPTQAPIKINATMIAPLNIGLNFPLLIGQIRKKKINVTLELIV